MRQPHCRAATPPEYQQHEAHRQSEALLHLGLGSASPTYFRGIELSHSAKRVGPRRGLAPGVSD